MDNPSLSTYLEILGQSEVCNMFCDLCKFLHNYEDFSFLKAVGERSRILKFSTHHQDQSMESSSNEREECASTYPCRSLCGSVQENRVEGVVLVVIQITGDPSAERTAPPRSTHVQPGDVFHALIQQGERERLRKTPSSSSTTAWWSWRSVVIQQGFAKHREI